MVIDWEHHLAPKKFAEMVKGVEMHGSLQVVLAQKYPIDVQLRDMDEAGVDKIVLTGAPRWNIEECRMFNNEIAEWVQEHPDRFIGFAHVPPLGGEESLEELDRAVKDLGFKGVMFRSSIDSMTEETSKDSILLNDPVLYPFYKKIVELDVPLFVHPAYFPLYPHAFPDPLRRRLKEIPRISPGLGKEFDLMVAVVSIVDGEVFEKFPNFKVVFSHLGGGIGAIWARLLRYVGTGDGDLKRREKSEKNFGKIYVDTAGIQGDIEALKFGLTKFSPNRIVFATDYPAEQYEDYPTHIKRFIQDIKSLDISDKDKQLILEGNAATLLKI
jgi:predicted TIM-barrel fold metal-dependent hydrolase